MIDSKKFMKAGILKWIKDRKKKKRKKLEKKN